MKPLNLLFLGLAAYGLLYHPGDKLAARYSVKEIGIFGSYVHGNQQPQSDLDILIDFDEYPSLLEFVG